MAQTLTTSIVINAKAGSGFDQVGNTLMELGSVVDGISQKLISFGKESVTVYRDYEKSMKDAEVALSTTYGRGTKELASVMSELDKSATNWAANTIFHTNDVGNAIAEAAHAGWDLEEIMSGLPAAMELAQAGSLDLSEAVNYIVKASTAAGVEFKDMGHFIDIWSFAANSSASTIDEFGQAMLRMGNTMQFAANPEELMTLIAVTANAGTVGSEAGTQIRNSLLRLIAPTDKAAEMMGQLGATSLETAGLLEDEALQTANLRLQQQGFSAYDQNGNLRSTLDIYRDLYVALGGIAGGYENISRNQDAMQIISAIFPSRTIAEALTLLNSAAAGYDGLYESMMGGDAADYGSYAAETMMDTLNGSLETFGSKMEHLQQVVGGELAGDVEKFSGFLGDIVDNLANMDDAQMGALVSALETIAAAGPGLLLAGGAFKLIGYMLTPAGGVGMGLIALIAAAAALQDISESNFMDQFGDMRMDTEGVMSYVDGLSSGFTAAAAEVNAYKDALNQSVDAYKTASSTFSGELLTTLLTGGELSKEAQDKLMGLGEEMHKQVLTGIKNSTEASMAYWTMLFGGDENASVDPQYQEIIDLTNAGYQNALAEAESIGQNIRNALTAAFADGQLSTDEYDNILSYMESYNDAMAKAAAEAQNEDDYVKMGKWLYKAQNASLEDIDAIAKQAQTERDEILASQEDAYLNERLRLEYRGASAAAMEEADARYMAQKAATSAKYDDFLATLWESQIRQSDQGGSFDRLSELTDMYLAGTLAADTVDSMLHKEMGSSKLTGEIFGSTSSDRYYLGKMLGLMVQSLGGTDALNSKLAEYRETGNLDMANKLYRLFAMEQLINSFDKSESVTDPIAKLLRPEYDYVSSKDWLSRDLLQDPSNRRNFEALMDVSGTLTAEAARKVVTEMSKDGNAIGDFFRELGKAARGEDSDIVDTYGRMTADDMREIANINEKLMATYDFEKVMSAYRGGSAGAFGEFLPMYELLYGGASKTAESYALKVPVSGDTTQLKNDIQAAASNGITVPVSGRADRGKTYTMFAEGGRSNGAAIFGEAGPEWAIPEEHTQRTADLLNAARIASGFSWPEIIGRFGGMNADAGHAPSTIVYSPTINATDATGVESALIRDKKRLEKWYEDMQMKSMAVIYQ